MIGGRQPSPIDVEVGEHSGRVEVGGGEGKVVMGRAEFMGKGSERRV